MEQNDASNREGDFIKRTHKAENWRQISLLTRNPEVILKEIDRKGSKSYIDRAEHQIHGTKYSVINLYNTIVI